MLYVKTRNYLLVRSSLARRVTSLEAFTADPTLRLAVVRSFKHGEPYDSWIEALRQKGRVDDYADAAQVAHIFALGRADAFLSEPVVWGPLLEKNGLDGRVAFLDLAAQPPVLAGLVLSRKRMPPAAIERIRAGVASMRADGTLLRIFRKYVPAHIAEGLIPNS